MAVSISLSHLDGFPAPVSVFLVFGEPPEDKVGLERLRPEDVVPLVGLEGPGLHGVGEAEGLGAKLGLCPVVGLVAGVGDAFGDAHPPVRVGVFLGGSCQPVHTT